MQGMRMKTCRFTLNTDHASFKVKLMLNLSRFKVEFARAFSSFIIVSMLNVVC